MKQMKPFTQKVTRKVRGTSEVYVAYLDTRTGKERARWWTRARIPGTVRLSRMPGGSSFRNNW